MNPYDPGVPLLYPSTNDRRAWLSILLIAYAMLGAVPPLPMMIWLGENEPFIYPELIGNTVFICATLLGIGWLAWAAILWFATWKKWYAKSARYNIAFAVFFGGLSFFDALLYLGDPAGRRFLGILE